MKRTLCGLLSKFNELDIREEEFSSDENEDGDEFVEVPEKLPRFDIEDEEVADANVGKKEVDELVRESNVVVVDSEQPTCSRCKYCLSFCHLTRL